MPAVSSLLKSGMSFLAKNSKGVTKAGIYGGLAFGADTAMNAYMGDDLGTSMVKAGVTGAIFASNPVLATAWTMGDLATDVTWGAINHDLQKRQWWNAQYAYNNSVGGNYVDTQRALTQRQAAVQAIQGSKLNARSALGGEAKIMNPYSTRRY